MRLRFRRVLFGGLLMAIACVFLVTLLHNSESLSLMERRANDAIDEIKRFEARNSDEGGLGAGLRSLDSDEEEEEDESEHFPPGKLQTKPAQDGASNVNSKNTMLSRRSVNVWEAGENPWNDRILDQLRYVPRSYHETTSELKTIFVPGGLWDTPSGRRKFQDEKCPVDKCSLEYEKHKGQQRPDAVLVQNSVDAMSLKRTSPDQIWILWLLESPTNTINLEWLNDFGVNWTASYRADSTIVTPYEKFVHFNNFTQLPGKPTKNYAEGKTKMVAWFVSNCAASNKRLEYARELRKHVPVDIYGGCGTLRCPRGHIGGTCDRMLTTDYKFYLSFENSNCEYYVTEKLFWNALLNDIVPVVMGARSEDYLHAAPPNSYIHVEDFASAQDLAHYLRRLDQNDDLYNKYFRWKHTGHFINTKFWCRLCSLLHDDRKPSLWVRDVETWWRQNETCTRDRWDNRKDIIDWDYKQF